MAKTNAGIDWIKGNLVSGLYMALTSDSTTPAAGDTTLTGEISTNGLARTAASATNNTGTSHYTVSATFTYTGSTPVTVNKMAIFTASSAGVMVYETALPSPVTFNASGDNATITDTITIS